MSILSMLPGLRDRTAVAQAYQTVRVSGLLGLCVLMTCYLALRFGLSADVFATPLFLALCWSIAMMGLSFLIDAWQGWLAGVRDGLLLHVIICFGVMGTGFTVVGTAGALFACWSILVS